MSRHNGRDYIFVVWRDHKTRQRFIIGELSQNGKYKFKYINTGVNMAIGRGFEPLVAFPNLDEVYENHELFPAFSSRLPDRRRKDVKEILSKYGLGKYDAFELLKKSGGKLPTDSMEFIDPIFLEDKNIEREFYVSGIRHYEYCDSKDKNKNFDINIGEEFALKIDSNNSYDKFAVKIINKDNKVIGYVPVFYSEAIFRALESKRNMECTVISNECNDECEDCIKVRVSIE